MHDAATCPPRFVTLVLLTSITGVVMTETGAAYQLLEIMLTCLVAGLFAALVVWQVDRAQVALEQE